MTAASAGAASLSDVKHIVILMQENRSFDHYFGTMSGVRGFSDPAVPTQTVGGATYPVFDQFGYQPGTGVDASGYMQPFNLLNNPPSENGEATNDIAHDWVTQHDSWNGGEMDSFIKAYFSNYTDVFSLGYAIAASIAQSSTRKASGAEGQRRGRPAARLAVSRQPSAVAAEAPARTASVISRAQPHDSVTPPPPCP